MSAARRKSFALKNVASRRSDSFSHSLSTSIGLSAGQVSSGGVVRPPDLKQLVRVFLLDGSSKLLQMDERSTVEDVLLQLKFNMELVSVSSHALFRVENNVAEMIPLAIRVRDLMEDLRSTQSEEAPKILFKSWVSEKTGLFERSVLQEGVQHKQPTTALWLAYMEAMYMTMLGKYILTEEESIMLGVLNMQIESGDFDQSAHTSSVMLLRLAERFPDPIQRKVQNLLRSSNGGNNSVPELSNYVSRAMLLYSRLTGMKKVDAQIEYLKMLRIWCPFYGCAMFEVDCQYDYQPTDKEVVPPVVRLTAAIGAAGIRLLSPTERNEHSVMLHAYAKILKFKAYPEQSIFVYWVLQKDTSTALQEAVHLGGEEFNADRYCDKVYLVSDKCSEIEFLVRSYVNMEFKDTRPQLPGCSEAYLLSEGFIEAAEHIAERDLDEHEFYHCPLLSGSDDREVLEEANQNGDDTSAVTNSVFKDLLGIAPSSTSSVDQEGAHETKSLHGGISTVKLAQTMEDLQSRPGITSGIFSFSSSDGDGDETGADASESEAASSDGNTPSSEIKDAAQIDSDVSTPHRQVRLGEGGYIEGDILESNNEAEAVSTRVMVHDDISTAKVAGTRTTRLSKIFTWG